MEKVLGTDALHTPEAHHASETLHAPEFEKKDLYLGIEFGSTRIKAVLIDATKKPIASGAHQWDNTFSEGFWTYSEDEIWTGIQQCFKKVSEDYEKKYHRPLSHLSSMGISAMMHGYLAFDKEGKMLVPFRTWRNTVTEEAAKILSDVFEFNIPQRWSIAHLYQAILSKEVHVGQIDYITTLSGYVHWQLTGEKTIGIGDASGMFPVDTKTGSYNQCMIDLFNSLLRKNDVEWLIQDILPEIRSVGEPAGELTQEGAKRLDPSGSFTSNVLLCPPEGDASTGMVATNSIAQKTGNISAGTSIFAMTVLEKPLRHAYPQIDVVCTPEGKEVAMVHCNNCLGDFDAWVEVFHQAFQAMGFDCKQSTLMDNFYLLAMNADPDGGGMLAYNYISGEHVTGVLEGRPMVMRKPDSIFNINNFCRTLLYSSLATLSMGMALLKQKENVKIDRITGHGGLFKAAECGQRLLAAAIETPVTVMKTAGEGGPWGMALLSAYAYERKENMSLSEYLQKEVFTSSEANTIHPRIEDVQGFNMYRDRYEKGIEIEKQASQYFK